MEPIDPTDFLAEIKSSRVILDFLAYITPNPANPNINAAVIIIINISLPSKKKQPLEAVRKYFHTLALSRSCLKGTKD
tara:strand:- start:2621 stop:2854 length:234 start_codon:yes stop_codon:yes gene_type:complete